MTARRGLLLAVAGGVLVAVGCSLVWFSAPVDSVVTGAVRVTGSRAAPGAVPLLLVVAASLVVRAMARGTIRRVLGWLGVLAWLALVATLATSAIDAEAPLRAAAAEMTGVGQLTGALTRGPGPWLALAGAILGTAGGVAVALVRSEPDAGRRYERTTTPSSTPGTRVPETAPDRVGDWDALSRGDDPSEGESK